jgi:hypothetical protein
MATDKLAKWLLLALVYAAATAFVRWAAPALLDKPDWWAIFAGTVLLIMWVVVTLLAVNYLLNRSTKEVK